jgi:regulatory protein YycH of two-component signal transduction system YycFG
MLKPTIDHNNNNKQQQQHLLKKVTTKKQQHGSTTAVVVAVIDLSEQVEEAVKRVENLQEITAGTKTALMKNVPFFKKARTTSVLT